MITARSPIGVLRTRIARGPLRMLWLTLLLTGLVYAHGVDTRTTSHHSGDAASVSAYASSHVSAPALGSASPSLSPTGTGASYAVADSSGTHSSGAHSSGAHSAARPAEHCMPGQSEQGSTVQAPGPGPLARPGSASCGHAPAPSLPPAAGRVDSPVPAIPDGPGLLRI
ncbi:hypothetical protein [Streptomyces sp. NPDC051567]|uniref:hypothetical protein n=1 Tax=Streptomyces sp. NPDC051567 TaxID=3365660 RepID=UPI0037B2A5DC